jgi:hypothetical protein
MASLAMAPMAIPSVGLASVAVAPLASLALT